MIMSKNQLNFTPLMASLIGADSLLDQLHRSQVSKPTFPPHNIEALGDGQYIITLAVAGFGEGDIEIAQEDKNLIITGTQQSQDVERTFLHKGIADRNFNKKFILGEYVDVMGADLKNGILSISLKQNIPDEKKPRKITIGSVHQDNIESSRDKES